MLAFILIISVLATSILSGVLGMAGGMLLMAILVSVLPVATTMLLHGAVQATSNGSRAWFLRAHINWSILWIYMIGALAAVGLFTYVLLVPPPGLVLILVGGFAWLARLTKRLQGLDITRPTTAVVCGFVVTAAQLLAGASGPLLDVFYLKSPLSRQQIVANKALTQTAGHILKIIYYGAIIGAVAQAGAGTTNLAWWIYAACMAAAVAGARIGTWMLNRWNDQAFQRFSQFIILSIATLCILQGVYYLVQNGL